MLFIPLCLLSLARRRVERGPDQRGPGAGDNQEQVSHSLVCVIVVCRVVEGVALLSHCR